MSYANLSSTDVNLITQFFNVMDADQDGIVTAQEIVVQSQSDISVGVVLTNIKRYLSLRTWLLNYYSTLSSFQTLTLTQVLQEVNDQGGIPETVNEDPSLQIDPTGQVEMTPPVPLPSHQ